MLDRSVSSASGAKAVPAATTPAVVPDAGQPSAPQGTLGADRFTPQPTLGDGETLKPKSVPKLDARKQPNLMSKARGWSVAVAFGGMGTVSLGFLAQAFVTPPALVFTAGYALLGLGAVGLALGFLLQAPSKKSP